MNTNQANMSSRAVHSRMKDMKLIDDLIIEGLITRRKETVQQLGILGYKLDILAHTYSENLYNFICYAGWETKPMFLAEMRKFIKELDDKNIVDLLTKLINQTLKLSKLTKEKRKKYEAKKDAIFHQTQDDPIKFIKIYDCNHKTEAQS